MVQAAQVSAVPSTKYLPPAQLVHCELSAALQVRLDEHPVTSVQAVQVTPSPKYPELQVHVTAPPVLAQPALVLQPPLFVKQRLTFVRLKVPVDTPPTIVAVTL